MTIPIDLNMIFLKVRPSSNNGVEFELVDYRQPKKTTVGFIVEEEFTDPNFHWCIGAVMELQLIMQDILTSAVRKKAELN